MTGTGSHPRKCSSWGTQPGLDCSQGGSSSLYTRSSSTCNNGHPTEKSRGEGNAHRDALVEDSSGQDAVQTAHCSPNLWRVSPRTPRNRGRVGAPLRPLSHLQRLLAPLAGSTAWRAPGKRSDRAGRCRLRPQKSSPREAKTWAFHRHLP